MAKYTLPGGDQVVAGTPAELVEAMRAGSFSGEATAAEFMVSAAARAAEQFGQPIRDKSPEDFVADLIKVGAIAQED